MFTTSIQLIYELIFYFHMRRGKKKQITIHKSFWKKTPIFVKEEIYYVAFWTGYVTVCDVTLADLNQFHLDIWITINSFEKFQTGLLIQSIINIQTIYRLKSNSRVDNLEILIYLNKIFIVFQGYLVMQRSCDSLSK